MLGCLILRERMSHCPYVMNPVRVPHRTINLHHLSSFLGPGIASWYSLSWPSLCGGGSMQMQYRHVLPHKRVRCMPRSHLDKLGKLEHKLSSGRINVVRGHDSVVCH